MKRIRPPFVLSPSPRLRGLVLAAAALAAAAANAGHVAETLSLSNGWNAVYLESTPETPAPADFFADLPQVERAGCYESSVFGSTEQIASDGTTIAQKPAAYLVWERGREDASTLQRMLGGRCYLIYCTAPAEKTFYGVPGVPRTSWQMAGDGGFLTMAGVSIPAGETIPAGVYFREGPATPTSLKGPVSLGGTNAAAPTATTLMSFRGTPSLEAGRAYALEGGAVADWAGVVRATVPSLSGAIAFSSGSSLQSFSVANAGTTNRTVRVEYGPSELDGETMPPLRVYLPRGVTNEIGWTEFGTHDLELAPGESRTLALAVDKSRFAPGATYAALVTVSDLGGTKMRVRLPVTAEADADGPYAAAFPKGLWYGNVTLVQVDRLSDGDPVPARGEMRASMMLLVDSDGAAHLMQRVAVATANEPDENGARATKLWPETAAVPSGWSSRRISTVFPDIAHRSVDATAPGAFGNLLQFDWTVAADAADNPFRHVWHPDHATGFEVTNRLALSWYTESGESTWEYSPDEVTYGICTWTLGGLSGTGDVKMRGTFALKRILGVSKIEE